MTTATIENGNGNGTGTATRNRLTGVSTRKSKTNGNGHTNGNGKTGGNGRPAQLLPPAEIELLAQRFEEKKLKAKKAYAKADQMEAELIAAIGLGGSLTMTDGRVIRVANNFIDKNGQPKVKHFGLAGVKIHEIVIK